MICQDQRCTNRTLLVRCERQNAKASSDREFDFLEDSEDGQFVEWLEESWLALEAGRDRKTVRS